MRKTLVSLIALGTAAAVSVSAFAQDAASTATATPAATTPDVQAIPAPTESAATNAAAATAQATPAVPAPAVQPIPVPTAAAPMAPMAPAPVPVPVPAPAVPVVEAPPPPPPAPTDPTTIQVLNVVEQICKPLVQGGDLQALAKPMGFRKNRDNSWTLRLQKPYQITVLPQGINKTVCDVDIAHAIGGDQPLTVGVHNYAIARGYKLYRNDEYTTDLKRHTRSWELVGEGQTEALVLVTEKKPDGSPVARNADHSTLMYSLTHTQ